MPKFYPESMLKGRLAEALIEGLFVDLGFNVYRYGMENTIPAIMKLLRGIRHDVANNIRKMPDFVVQHPENKEFYFIEVKFRANGCFNKEYFKGEHYPYPNCFFIVISTKHIKCISYEELCRRGEISPNSKNYLGNRQEFAFDKSSKDKIIEYCGFAEKFYSAV